jgi:hypothetical protein
MSNKNCLCKSNRGSFVIFLVSVYFCKMKQKFYEYQSENELLWYEFESVSEVKITV